MKELTLRTKASESLERGDLPKALRLLRQLTREHPANLQGWKLLGIALQRSSLAAEALAAWRHAQKLAPDDPLVHAGLGNLLSQLGQNLEAAEHFEASLRIAPGNASTHYNLAEVKRATADNAVAERHYQLSLALHPGFSQAHCGLGEVQAQTNRPQEAAQSFRAALALEPHLHRAMMGLAGALKSAERLSEAIDVCQDLIKAHPDSAKALHLMGTLLYEEGLLQEAAQSLERAAALPNPLPATLWWLAICKLNATHFQPSSDPTTQQVQRDILGKLEAQFLSEDMAHQGHHCVGLVQPFYIAYRRANNLSVLAQYGQLCSKLMAQWRNEQQLVRKNLATRGKVRLGIVSGKIHKHSVWTAIVRGWVMHLDPNVFEICIFHLGNRVDQETELARARCSKFVHGHADIKSWVASIIEFDADVLLYPEVGMDPFTLRLAAMRLAPVQAASWGHPETTGLPTIDYYLSADLLESSKAQDYYSERLVTLPNLGCTYSAQRPEEVTLHLGDVGLDPARPILLCPGYSYKYAEEDDLLWVELCARLPDAQLVFFINPRKRAFSIKLQQRLQQKMIEAGQDPQGRLVFVPWLDESRFFSLMRQATAFLDTIGFSGFNTVMQAAECGLPIVTMEGEFLRGRLGSGILTRMGLAQLIAPDKQAYVDLAAKLCTDPAYRTHIQNDIQKNSPILFNDRAPALALQNWLVDVCTELKPAPRTHQPKIAAVSMVRNEADIIELFIRINARVFDAFYILDHFSEDNTPKIIELLKAQGYRISYTRLGDVPFEQDRLLSSAARQVAATDEFDYVMPLDADEFLSSELTDDIPRLLQEKLSTTQFALIPWQTFCPVSAFAPDKSVSLFETFRARKEENPQTYKVIMGREFAKQCRLSMGCHHAKNEKFPQQPDILPLVLQHVPIRSAEQLIRKCVLGSHTFALKPNRHPINGYHWDDLTRLVRSKNYQLDANDVFQAALDYQVPLPLRRPNELLSGPRVGRQDDHFQWPELASVNLLQSFDKYIADMVQRQLSQVKPTADTVQPALSVHAISLARSLARRDDFRRHNPKLSFEWFDAVDGAGLSPQDIQASGVFEGDLPYTAGALGCALSHIRLWELAVRENKAITVCEDDAVFREDFQIAHTKFLASLPANWEFVAWGWNFDSILSLGELEGVSPAVMLFSQADMRNGLEDFKRLHHPGKALRLDKCLGTPAYSISPTGAAKLRKLLLPLRPFELFFPYLNRKLTNNGIDIALNTVYGQINSYACFPPLVITPNQHATSTVQTRGAKSNEASAPVSIAHNAKMSSFAEGLAVHRHGDIGQAQAIYEAILLKHPDDFDALHMQGVAHQQLGRPKQCIEFIQKALRTRFDVPAAHNNLGNAYREIAAPGRALACYVQALQIDPAYTDAYFNSAIVLREMGEHERALNCLTKALALNPENAAANNNRGNILHELNRHEEALACYEEALRHKPDFADAYCNQGNALLSLGRQDQALASYNKALELAPQHADALYNSGTLLKRMHQLPAAIQRLEAALQVRPQHAETHNNLGNTYLALKRPAQALACYDNALAIHPRSVEALYNKGNALKELDRLEEAIEAYTQALALQPNHVESLTNRGSTFQALNQFTQAIQDFDRATSLQPDLAEAHWNKGLCLLSQGDYEQGWPLYEWRWKREDLRSKVRHFEEPLWLGDSSLQGKTILLYAEQGLGDTIQFCRYAPLVKALGATVILEVQPPLKSLMTTLAGVDHVIAKGELGIAPLPPIDYQCPLLSLPVAFKTTLETVPSPEKYLSADPAKVAEWRQKLGPKTKPRIGVVWSSASNFKGDAKRSMKLEDFLKCIPKGAFELICLQKVLKEEDKACFEAYGDMYFHGDELEDFSDTAALAMNMDLVISTCTSVPHLSSALGIKTLLLLSAFADFRWLSFGNTSPWYDAIKIFRAMDSSLGNPFKKDFLERISYYLLESK